MSIERTDPTRKLAQEAERTLRAHLLDGALHARGKYSPLTIENLEALLRDPECVRLPTRVVFARGPMAPHQFAQPETDPLDPSGAGKVLYVDPRLRGDFELLPLAVAYFVPVIEHGEELVGDRHCVAYGAALLAMSEKGYYRKLCALADRLGVEPRFDIT
jgi:hypothetical protein